MFYIVTPVAHWLENRVRSFILFFYGRVGRETLFLKMHVLENRPSVRAEVVAFDLGIKHLNSFERWLVKPLIEINRVIRVEEYNRNHS